MRTIRAIFAGVVFAGPLAVCGSAPPAGTDPGVLDLEALLNVKVTTASKFSENLSDAPGVMSVLTKDEIRRFGGTTLAELLAHVPGLNFSVGFVGDRVAVGVRGDQTSAGGGHALILINGRPVREILAGGVSSDVLQSFPVSVIERIEVIKGPGSVLYGSDAFSGVVNVITKAGNANGFHVSGGGGASGLAAGSEQISYHRGDLSIIEGAEYHQMPRWQTYFRGLSITGVPSVQLATIRDEGTGGYLGIDYKGLTFMASYTALEFPSFVGGLVGDFRSKRGFADLGYALPISKAWQMKFNTTYTRVVQDGPDFPGIHRDSYEALAEWTNFVKFSERDRITFGALISHINGTELFIGGTPFVDSQGSRNGSAIYLQYEHKLTADLKLIGGVQANKIGAIALNAVPRAGVLWNANSHWSLRALYGGAFRAPALDNTQINAPGIKGNPNLVPETVGTLDLQVSYASKRTQASVDYFHSRQSNLIETTTDQFPALFYNLKTPAIFEGFDAEGKHYMKRDWFLFSSALYQITNGMPPGSPVTTVIPRLTAKGGVSYSGGNGAELSVFDSFLGHIVGFGASHNTVPHASHSIDAQVRFDVSKRWIQSDTRGVAFFVHANDLLNQQLWVPYGVQNSLPAVRGRTILFGMEVWRKGD